MVVNMKRYKISEKCIRFMELILRSEELCCEDNCKSCMLCAVGSCHDIIMDSDVDVKHMCEQVEISCDDKYIYLKSKITNETASRDIYDKDFCFILDSVFDCKI